MEAKALVDRCVELILRLPRAEHDNMVQLLAGEGIARDDAECLMAFVPMAFAHAHLGPMGARLPRDFRAWDPDTKDSEIGVLSEEPLFARALAAACAMLRSDGGPARVLLVAARSAEWDGAQKLARDGSTLQHLVFTPPALLRVPPAYFRRQRSTRLGRWLPWRWLGRR